MKKEAFTYLHVIEVVMPSVLALCLNTNKRAIKIHIYTHSSNTLVN